MTAVSFTLPVVLRVCVSDIQPLPYRMHASRFCCMSCTGCLACMLLEDLERDVRLCVWLCVCLCAAFTVTCSAAEKAGIFAETPGLEARMVSAGRKARVAIPRQKKCIPM